MVGVNAPATKRLMGGRTGPLAVGKPIAGVRLSPGLLTFEDSPGSGVCLDCPPLYVVANLHLQAE